MWGLYVAKTRADIASQDPTGQSLMENTFFHPYLTYNARIDSNFSGVFSLAFDESIPYSHHAWYLKDITLLGSKDIQVRINELDNDITGNEGANTVIFSGPYNEYQVITVGDETSITDNNTERDGVNTVRKIEKLQFTDQTIEI